MLAVSVGRLRRPAVVGARGVGPGLRPACAATHTRAAWPPGVLLRPDRDRLAAPRPAVALQGGPGDRRAVVGDGPAPGRNDHRLRHVPGRLRRPRPVAGRRARPAQGADARLPRPRPEPAGAAARARPGLVTVATTCRSAAPQTPARRS